MGLLNFHQESELPPHVAAAQRVQEISNALRDASRGLARPAASLAGVPMLPGAKRPPSPEVLELLMALTRPRAAAPLERPLLPGLRK